MGAMREENKPQAGEIGAAEVIILAAGFAGAALILWQTRTGTPLAFAALKTPSTKSDTASLPNDASRTLNNEPQTNASPDTRTLPERVLIAVPFASQAPFESWRDPYQDACEEASVLMAIAWARGDTSITPARANREILDEIAFEDFYFGYHNDTAVRETAKILTLHYDYRNVAVRYDISLDDIKHELAAGNIVIVPTAGALLKNPYYTNLPPYHMVVVRGYDDGTQEFTTNDPGTRHGDGYRYSYQTLWDALHDWTGSDTTILEGRKAMIVVSPRANNGPERRTAFQ